MNTGVETDKTQWISLLHFYYTIFF